jgi:hypothetical protein
VKSFQNNYHFLRGEERFSSFKIFSQSKYYKTFENNEEFQNRYHATDIELLLVLHCSRHLKYIAKKNNKDSPNGEYRHIKIQIPH